MLGSYYSRSAYYRSNKKCHSWVLCFRFGSTGAAFGSTGNAFGASTGTVVVVVVLV